MRTVKGGRGGRINILEKGETANPNGRPKNTYTSLNKTLVKEGYEPLTKAAFMEAYSLLFALDEQRILEIAEDATQPLALRLIIKEIVEPKTSGRAIQNIRDFLFGNRIEKSETNASISYGQNLTNKLSDTQITILEILANDISPELEADMLLIAKKYNKY
jgi:hypothetical protein